MALMLLFIIIVYFGHIVGRSEDDHLARSKSRINEQILMKSRTSVKYELAKSWLSFGSDREHIQK